MTAAFADHFSGAPGEYAEYRPRYPEALFDWLAGETAPRSLAWDCATGSGQAALGLARRFDRVIATDASPEQIATAAAIAAHPRVEYRVAPAEASGLGAGSADLVTVAQALHWFDRPAFYAEARRVLRPKAVLAAWSYGHVVVDHEPADRILRGYYAETVGPYWPAERALVDDGYRTIDFPFEEIDPPAFEMCAEWTLAALLGYAGTWSATTRFRKARGIDPVSELARELEAVWGDPETRRGISWPLAVRAGRERT